MGRSVDISDPTVVTEGATNYILVDRGDILSTAFDEIKETEDLGMTLQEQFYNGVSYIFAIYSRINNKRSYISKF